MFLLTHEALANSSLKEGNRLFTSLLFAGHWENKGVNQLSVPRRLPIKPEHQSEGMCYNML